MIDPQLPLQAAIVAAVKADTELNTLIAGRIFDRVPVNQDGSPQGPFPYLSFGAADTTDEGASCVGPSDCYIDLNGWSRAVGYPEVKRIGARAAFVLNTRLTVAGFEVVTHRVDRLSYQREQDGLTSRAILRLRYGLRKAA
ncbi:DUF3168 domain-containing protein [Brevundimonas sp. DS20]|uniref:DUF3168 domain-containing protein n=1 Tax=Brevundimonas sp. DS20 TaxID=1532555 RepID=UPI0006D0FFF8|nr:DUF3168 domain-containing protein [Brevundimonas sp. DS20]ALJ08234.1 hypothetical protein JL11_07680 [Brevundimonas sp. DS20]